MVAKSYEVVLATPGITKQKSHQDLNPSVIVPFVTKKYGSQKQKDTPHPNEPNSNQNIRLGTIGMLYWVHE